MKSNKNHIFLDTNVLIGAYLGKELDKKCLQYLFSLTGKKLYISTLSIAQLVSVFQKKQTNQQIKKIVENLMTKFTLIGFSDKDVAFSLNFEDTDMEDNIQYVISRKFNCFYFITNNRKDYVNFFNIEVLKPNEVRNIYQNEKKHRCHAIIWRGRIHGYHVNTNTSLIFLLFEEFIDYRNRIQRQIPFYNQS